MTRIDDIAIMVVRLTDDTTTDEAPVVVAGDQVKVQPAG